jgi:hypothetical protein
VLCEWQRYLPGFRASVGRLTLQRSSGDQGSGLPLLYLSGNRWGMFSRLSYVEGFIAETPGLHLSCRSSSKALNWLGIGIRPEGQVMHYVYIIESLAVRDDFHIGYTENLRELAPMQYPDR